MINPPTSYLTENNSHEILVFFCESQHIDHRNAKLLRLGANALYHIPQENIVIRIHGNDNNEEKIRLEINISSFLIKNGINSASISKKYSDIYFINGKYITVWNYIESHDRPGSYPKLYGKFLRRFHNAMNECKFTLPLYAPLQTIESRIKLISKNNDAGRLAIEQIKHRIAEVKINAREVDFVLDFGPIHGDAHTGNTVYRDNKIYILDFENLAIGYRDWDIIPTCVIAKRFDLNFRLSEFLKSYESDLTLCSFDENLIRIRELFMISWLSQRAGESRTIDDEIILRLETLDKSGEDGLWHPM